MNQEDRNKEGTVYEGRGNGQKPSKVPGRKGPEQNQPGNNQESSRNSLYVEVGEGV